jgi:hypothetical protein
MYLLVSDNLLMRFRLVACDAPSFDFFEEASISCLSSTSPIHADLAVRSCSAVIQNIRSF